MGPVGSRALEVLARFLAAAEAEARKGQATRLSIEGSGTDADGVQEQCGPPIKAKGYPSRALETTNDPPKPPCRNPLTEGPQAPIDAVCRRSMGNLRP